MKQYEIWWAALPAPAGRRPVMLLSRDTAYSFLTSVLVAEITTRIRGIPQEVTLGRREGLDVSCVANFDSLQTIARERLEERAGRISAARVRDVKRAMGFVLMWPELAIEE